MESHGFPHTQTLYLKVLRDFIFLNSDFSYHYSSTEVVAKAKRILIFCSRDTIQLWDKSLSDALNII